MPTVPLQQGLRYLWHAPYSLRDLNLLTEWRDAASGKVVLNTFLNYGGGEKEASLKCMLTGWPPFGDTTYYIGLLPLAFIGWGLLRRPHPRLWVFLIPALVLILLSFGGFFARLIYYFPTMAYYRHVGLVYGPVRILLLISAGYGFEDFQCWVRENSWGRFTFPQALAVALIGFLPFDHYLSGGLEQFSSAENRFLWLQSANWILVCVRLGLCGALVALILTVKSVQWVDKPLVKRLVGVGLGVVCLFDVGSYRYMLHAGCRR